MFRQLKGKAYRAVLEREAKERDRKLAESNRAVDTDNDDAGQCSTFFTSPPCRNYERDDDAN